MWNCNWASPGIVEADLLEVGSEAVHVLVIGQHGVCLRVEEVDVPDAQQSQQDGSVLIQRSGAEVVVLQERNDHPCVLYLSTPGKLVLIVVLH